MYLNTIIPAGNPDQEPCIDSAEAIILNYLMLDHGIKGGCQRMYSEKCKQTNFNKWTWPSQQARDSDSAHCPELYYDGKEVLPTSQWLSAVQQAYAQLQADPSTTKRQPTAKTVKTVMELLGNRICVSGRQHGISKLYVTQYVQQCEQLIDTHQAEAPRLAVTESEVHIFFQPIAAMERPPCLLLGPSKVQVDMVLDPMPDPQAEHQRYVVVCRLPRNHSVEYDYDTGSNACMHVISVCMLLADCLAMPACL